MSNILNEFRRMAFAGEISLVSADVRAMLLMEETSAESENAGVSRLSHFTSLKEFDGSGYSRQPLANKSLTKDDDAGRVEYSADNLAFGNLSGGTADPAGVLLFKYVDGTAANDIPLAYLPFSEPLAVDGTSFVVQWDSDIALVIT